MQIFPNGQWSRCSRSRASNETSNSNHGIAIPSDASRRRCSGERYAKARCIRRYAFTWPVIKQYSSSRGPSDPQPGYRGVNDHFASRIVASLDRGEDTARALFGQVRCVTRHERKYGKLRSAESNANEVWESGGGRGGKRRGTNQDEETMEEERWYPGVRRDLSLRRCR